MGHTHSRLQAPLAQLCEAHQPGVTRPHCCPQGLCQRGPGTLVRRRAHLRPHAHLGVAPNAYTLAVLVKGLAASDRCSEAGKYLVEMLDRGMRPNVATYLAVFEAYVRLKKLEEGKMLLETTKGFGFALDEEDVRNGTVKRGHLFKCVMSMLFDK
jgi:pentatricopeptide repeat protein